VRASGGAGKGWDLPGPGLVVVVVLGDGLGLGGIKRRGLIEVVWEVTPGKVFDGGDLVWRGLGQSTARATRPPHR
jgi:hypothetical protein